MTSGSASDDPPPQEERPVDPRLRRAVDNARILAAELHRARVDRPDESPIVPPPPGLAPPVPAPPVPTPGVTRPTADDQPGLRTLICAWDLAHNPAGRALVLHDLAASTGDAVVMGPCWPEFGTALWRPLRDLGLATESFPADSLTSLVANAFPLAARAEADTVIVAKTRLPSLVVGCLVQRATAAALVCDIDDEETTFVDETDTRDLIEDPTGAAATRWATETGSRIAARTVSNVALRERHGGIIVRHARDEDRFDPERADRAAGRARLGATRDDRVVLFVGTPRPHKGLRQVIDALADLDERYVLHVVGAADPSAAEAELGRPGVRIHAHPPCGFEVLPDLLCAADAVALLQDPEDPISRFQVPAKISDALALGVPVLVAPTAPVADLHGSGITIVEDTDTLRAALAELDDGAEAATRRRTGFLTEFSISVNAPRLDAARRMADTADPVASEVVAETRDRYEEARRRERPDLFAPIAASGRAGAPDVVFFWKQNDSDVYGRRADMLAEQFARSDDYGRVVHFDAPIEVRSLARALDRPVGEVPEDTTTTNQNVLDRHLRLLDRPGFTKRVFVYSDHGDLDPFSGEPLPDLAAYPTWVADELADAGVDPALALAWVCPIVPGFSAVTGTIEFGATACDIVDDERVSTARRTGRDQLDAAYAAVLPTADAVFTNCSPNVAAFAAHAPEVVVVPNGADVRRMATAAETRRPGRRVVYVGDMRSRIDWTLLEEVVAELADHQFVLAGSTDGTAAAVDRLAAQPNVEFRGVVPYPDVPRLLAEANVAIVPHLSGPMTERMNPLKVYNYVAAGLPVVTTPVENIDELAGAVTVAPDAGAFAAAVREARAPEPVDLGPVDWTARLRSISRHLRALGVLPEEQP